MVNVSPESSISSQLRNGCWLLALALPFLPGLLLAQDETVPADLYSYEVTEVVEDVFVLRTTLNRGGFANSNIAVIVDDDGVLVVDSGFIPAAATVAISEIRKLTDAPVRYVVNTHWHADHWQGNEAFADAYPGVTFVAVESGRDEIADRGVSDAAYFADKFRDDVDVIRGKIAERKDTDGSNLDPKTVAELQDWLPLKVFAASQLSDLRPTLPTLTFERRLTLRLGLREIRVLFLGLGNTKGDAVIYLPEEQVVITGAFKEIAMKNLIYLFSLTLLSVQAYGQTDTPVEDPSIEAPRIIGARAYQSDDGSSDSLLFSWNAVPEAVAYQLYRGILVTMRLDEAGGLVPLDEPEMAWMPWVRVDAIPGEDEVRAIVATLDNVVTRWGLAAEFERDGQRIRSSISIYELSLATVPTAVEVSSWGSVKSQVR